MEEDYKKGYSQGYGQGKADCVAKIKHMLSYIEGCIRHSMQGANPSPERIKELREKAQSLRWTLVIIKN